MSILGWLESLIKAKGKGWKMVDPNPLESEVKSEANIPSFWTLLPENPWDAPNLYEVTLSSLIVHIYRDAKNEFRWRLVSRGNHKILAVSSEGYKSKQALNKSLLKIKDEFRTAEVVEK